MIGGGSEREGMTGDYLSVDSRRRHAAARRPLRRRARVVEAESTDSPFRTEPMTDPRPTVYVETYGCQMNVSDSELMLGTLAAHGYDAVDGPTART